ncbi:MAG: SDR family NAD(P)-dependent oxidoreductase [Dehalococcoidia bacterium]
MVDKTRVLVTGGAGFIGSHVVDALIERGYDVAVLDDLSSGSRANLNAKASFYEADVRDPAAVDQVFSAVRPQLVNHHAAQISVTQSAKDPVADASANVIGSLVVFEACRRYGVEHLTFASTGGALYGEPSVIPANEQTPILPLSPYGAAKASVEVYLRMYQATWAMPAVALRYANVYGPRQSPHGEAGVVAIFAARMLAGQTCTIFGSGEQQRDFVYVGDVAAANVIAMDQRLEGAFNVGTGKCVSVNEIASVLARACGSHSQPAHAPDRAGEVQRISLDSSLLHTAAGWSPRTPLDEGLRLVVDHMRNAAALRR